ncbi:hypothetical protein BMS3Abin03_00841 [bacterium BMS3Abin03]|nr:hypothetical protein BMS3Abin03_00841 [bacterium BMS3Abin03]
MQIKVKIIRDLEIIEKELNSISTGVLAIPFEENFEQIAANFVYHNKNIFVFLQNKEQYRNIKFGSTAKFTAIKDVGRKGKAADDKNTVYNLFYVSVNGIIKKVEEKKLKNTIKQSFIQKYSGRLIETDSKPKSLGKLLFIDSEELFATEEIGS